MQRRDLVFGGGLPLIVAGAFATAGTATDRKTARFSAAELANIRLVKDYLAAWDTPTVDIDKVVSQYMAPNVLLRWFDDEPTYVGRNAAAKAAKKDAPDGVRVISEILDVFAIRSLVVTSRVDTVKLPGKEDQVLRVAGVCVVKKGLIQEYVDYVTT
jgi:limonene-1,2-epoxide hydrolase